MTHVDAEKLAKSFYETKKIIGRSRAAMEVFDELLVGALEALEKNDFFDERTFVSHCGGFFLR